ncbi:MAG: hypothetical protein R8M37_02110 [Alphaproteobacteria bacterium]|nr:hypothetical protein [Alphaproteobacteria bacterium]
MNEKNTDFEEIYAAKSYKMVWPADSLPDGLSISFNIKSTEEYTPGRQFTAIPRKNYFGGFGVRATEPVFHFCDNAVDMLLWYWEVYDFIDYDTPTITFLEIKPIGTIYKNQAPDKTELWQCGANQIEIVRHTNIKQVAQDACKEIAQNQDEIIARYPNHNMVRYIAKIKRIAQK